MPVAQQTTPELYSIVVLGQMNPPIHHPLWYRQLELIDEKEKDSALASPQLVALPQVLQFTSPAFSVVCVPDRWEINTTRSEFVDRMVFTAAQVFDALDHTPVSAYGFNLMMHSQTEVPDVGRAIAETLVTLPLGLGASAEMAGEVSLQTEEGDKKTTVGISRSPLGKQMAWVRVNTHYDIRPSKDFEKFDLSALIREHFRPDLEKAIAHIRAAAEGMAKLGATNGSRA